MHACVRTSRDDGFLTLVLGIHSIVRGCVFVHRRPNKQIALAFAFQLVKLVSLRIDPNWHSALALTSHGESVRSQQRSRQLST